MKRSLSYIISIIALLSSINTYSQEDTCSFVKQIELALFFDYNSMYNIVQYYEQYHDFQDNESISDNLEEIYQRILISACSIFSERDLVELQKLYDKYRIDDLEEFNKIMDVLGDYENLNIEHLLYLLFEDDPEYQNVIGKMKVYLQIVMQIVERFVIEEQLIEQGITPNAGIVDYYLENYKESLAYFNNRLQLDQDTSITSFIFQGRNYRALGKIDSSITSYCNAVEYYPQNYELYFELADIYYWMKQDDSTAYRYIKRSLQIEPEYYYSNILLGAIHRNRNEFDEAITIFTSLINKYPEKIDAFIERGLTYLTIEDYDAARPDFNTAYSYDIHSIEAIVGKSRVHLGKYELDSSYSVLNQAIQLYPDDIDLNILLGETYLLTENYDSCAMCYSKVVEDSITFFILNNIGFCKMKIEAYDDAIELFTRLIEEYPVNDWNQIVIAFAYNNLAYCYMKTGMYSESLKNIDTSLQLYPDNPCAFINGIKVEELMGKENDHCEDIKNAVSMQFFEYCGEDANALIKNYCE